MSDYFNSPKAVTLTELLIAIVLVSLVLLAATSVDITSRRFFNSLSKGSLVQDEAKIVMEHIVKNVQLGIGDVTGDDKRGFTVYDNGAVADQGSRIQVNIDGLKTDIIDGKFEVSGLDDGKIEYSYRGSPDYKIVFDPNVDQAKDEEEFAKGMVYNATFGIGSAPNQVKVSITVRKDPTQNPSLENPQTTLTSSIVLRAMSCQ